MSCSTMVVRGLKMYVFGGMTTNSTIPQNILWQYDMSSRLWTQVTPLSPDKPPGRAFHQSTLTWDSRYLVIYGGIHCFTRIQMVSLEKGLKEYHMQQDSLEYSAALEDVVGVKSTESRPNQVVPNGRGRDQADEWLWAHGGRRIATPGTRLYGSTGCNLPGAEWMVIRTSETKKSQPLLTSSECAACRYG